MLLVDVFQVQKDTVRKISDLSVDKLIAFYIQTKGTGKEIPSELICVHVCVPMSLLMIIAENCPTFHCLLNDFSIDNVNLSGQT